MPRSLADPLYERLLRSFPADQDYTRADWNRDAMPEPVAHFLRRLLSHYSRREARRLRRARTDWVDYDHPQMEKAVRTFFDAVESHTRVPADEWEDTLRQATRHTTAHLVQPIYVLSDFVYGEQEKALGLPEVLWRMNFFGPYGYLREAVHAFAKKQNLDALGPDRFDRFLHRVDERITSEFGADRWLRMLDPLFKVARRASDRERVPIELLEPFFFEKNATGIEQRLRRYRGEGHSTIGPKALYRLIEEADARPKPSERSRPSQQQTRDAPASRDSAEPSSPESPRPSTSDMPTDDEIWGVAGSAQPEGSSKAQRTRTSDESAPLWKRFQQGGTNAARSKNGDEDEGHSERSQQPLWAQFRRGRDERLSDAVGSDAGSDVGSGSDSPTVQESGDSAPSGFPQPERSPADEALESLEQEILGTTNPPHRAVYIRQLFNGDETAYRRVLNRLRTADSWGEASQIIARDIFRTYKVNIYSDAAVHFTNAVESRFRDA